MARPREQHADDGPTLIDLPRKHGPGTATIAAYDYDYAAFSRWASARGHVALPASPLLLSEYFALLGREKRPTTIQRFYYAMRAKHQSAGHASPTDHPLVREALREALKVAKGRLPPSDDPLPALPQRDLEIDQLRLILDAMDRRLAPTEPGPPAQPPSPGERLRDLRDRAILLLLFSGAMKRDEARTLEYGNLEPIPEGLRFFVNASPDRPTAARHVDVLLGDHEETCPVRALLRYLQAADIGGGPVFRRIFDSGDVGESVLSQSRMSKMWEARCKAAGLDPKRVSPRSFRSSFAIAAARNGATLDALLKQTGHRNPTNLLRMLRRANLYPNHAQRFTGL
jgi:integrase